MISCVQPPRGRPVVPPARFLTEGCLLAKNFNLPAGIRHRSGKGSVSRAGRAEDMIVPLSQIGPEGWHREIRMSLGAFARLGEMHGPQTGELLGEVTLKNRGGTVELTGSLRATVMLACQRCLDPVSLEIEESIQVTLAPEAGAAGTPGEEVRLEAADLDVSFYGGDAIDLSMVLEDELILMIPEPACEETEDGRCACCGQDITRLLQTGAPDETFHPLAALRGMVRGTDRKDR